MMEKHLGWKILTWKERPTYNLISEKGFFQKRIAWSTPHGVVIDAMGIAIVCAKASPSGSRADHSLHGLWQSQTPKGAMALFGDSVDCRFFSINTSMIWYVVQLSSIFLVRALFIFTCTACTRGTLPPKWKAPLSRSSVAFRRQGWYTQSPLNSQMHWNYFRLLSFVFCFLLPWFVLARLGFLTWWLWSSFSHSKISQGHWPLKEMPRRLGWWVLGVIDGDWHKINHANWCIIWPTWA